MSEVPISLNSAYFIRLCNGPSGQTPDQNAPESIDPNAGENIIRLVPEENELPKEQIIVRCDNLVTKNASCALTEGIPCPFTEAKAAAPAHAIRPVLLIPFADPTWSLRILPSNGGNGHS
jgi:hypothetical protein